MTEQFNLEESEHICDKCGGTGRINTYSPYNSYIRARRRKVFCPMCQGTGRLDWIENIVGKKPIIFSYSFSQNSRGITVINAAKKILNMEV